MISRVLGSLAIATMVWSSGPSVQVGAQVDDTPPAEVDLGTPATRRALRPNPSSGERVLVTYRSGRVPRAVMQQRIASGVRRVHRRFALSPTMLVDADVKQIARLADDPQVESIVADLPAPAADTESTPLVGATATHAGGIDGTGTMVAVLDTGVDSNHPMLAGKVVSEACFAGTGSCPNGSTVQVGTGAAAPCSYATRGCRHGTHVAGIAAGRHTDTIPFDGVAPGADIIAVQVFTRFDGDVCFILGQAESPCTLSLPSDRIRGLEFVAYLTGWYNIAAANMSIGGGLFDAACDFDPETPIIELLRIRNVATTISAGNDGSSTQVSAPGCISSAVTVGATNKLDGYASFTNSNPLVDVVAPGVSINSSIPGGGTAFFNGTSMAAPHVMGAFALGRQALPQWSLDALQQRLVDSGPVLIDPRNNLGFHRLDVMAAFHTVQIDPGIVVANEGDSGSSVVSIPITLSRTSTLPVSAQVALFPLTTESDDVTASAGSVTFAPGTTSATYPATVFGDTAPEGDELFLIVLHSPTNGAIGGFWGLGVLVIHDEPSG